VRISAGPKTEEEALEEINTMARRTVSFCPGNDKENSSDVVTHHAFSQSARSHARTASDMDSVIMMGNDDSSILEFGPCKSTDTLSQIFDLIDAGREAGFVISPG
jgi:hypothetical protein